MYPVCKWSNGCAIKNETLISSELIISSLWMANAFQYSSSEPIRKWIPMMGDDME